MSGKKGKQSDFKLTNKTQLVEKATEESITAGLEMVGLQVISYAKLKCPVDTGLLRNSLAYAVSGQVPSVDTSGGTSYKAEKPKNGEIAKGTYKSKVPKDSGINKKVYVGTQVKYAASVEFGYSGRRAKPFLKPAIEEHMDEYRQILESKLKGK